MFYTQDAAQDAEGFLIAQLSYIEPQVYRIQYPAIRYRSLVPIDTSAPEWISSVTYFSLDGAGRAAWFNGRANDVPLAEIVRSKYETPVAMGAIGYEYDLEELSQAAMLGRNLDTDKASYAREVAEQFIDNVAIFGDVTKGPNFTGLANNPSVPTSTAAAVGAGSATTFASKTPQQTIADMNQAIGNPMVATSGVEMANTILLPWAHYNFIAGAPYSPNSNSNLTILDWIKEKNVYTARTGEPLQIAPVFGLETAGAGGTARMVAYWKDPAVVKMHIPMPFQFVGGVWRDGPILWKRPGIFRLGGVDIKRPAAFRYMDGI